VIANATIWPRLTCVARLNEDSRFGAKAREVLKDSALFYEEMARMHEARREYASRSTSTSGSLTQPESQRQVQKQITNLEDLRPRAR
jgi:hypothetical protein